MLANYHTHTSRCHHAIGSDEEYIQKAIAEGLKILGFSDHAPYLYPNGYVSYYKMTPDEAPEYFSSLSALREKYKDYIKIHIGYEAEYYPEIWNETVEFWKTANSPEYIILGQHFSTQEYAPAEKRHHSTAGTDDCAKLIDYTNLVIDAVNTGKFTYVAHPDLFNFFGDEDLYREQVRRLVLATKAKNVPLEINILGLRTKRNYPTPLFWDEASKLNPGVVIGCDAHDPKDVANKDDVLNALRFADKYKLNVIEEIELVNPFN